MSNETSEDTKRKPWRPGKYWRLADKYAAELLTCLPGHVRAASMATCRFELRGLNANGNDWGVGVVTRFQSFGEMPDGTGHGGQPCCQVNRNWSELDSHEGADIILGCFGLSIDDVYDRFGRPITGERKRYDLYDLLAAMMPDMIDETITTAPTVEAEAA